MSTISSNDIEGWEGSIKNCSSPPLLALALDYCEAFRCFSTLGPFLYRNRPAEALSVTGLREENQRLQEHAARLEEENGRLKRELWDLKQRFAALEARLNQNSGNSSKPPSSDPPSVKLPPKRKPSGRRPGGQPGHKGSCRELLPPDQVDAVEHHWPTVCEKCERPTQGRVDVGEPVRHQVTEVPQVKAHVTEHQMHSEQADGAFGPGRPFRHHAIFGVGLGLRAGFEPGTGSTRGRSPRVRRATKVFPDPLNAEVIAKRLTESAQTCRRPRVSGEI